MNNKTTLKRDGFENERHAVVPSQMVTSALQNPITRDLLPTAIGHFPNAIGHYVKRIGESVLGDTILIYCSDGSGWFNIGGHPQHLNAGSAVVIPADTAHSYGSTKQHPWTIYWVHFTGKRVPDYLSVLNVSIQRPVLHLQEMGEVIHQFESMYGLLINDYTTVSLIALSTALSNFLGQITLHRRTDNNQSRSPTDQVKRTIPFMHRHLTSNVTITELAEVAALSVPHYTSLFKSLTGISPKAYYLKLKMEYAAHILETTHATIKETAARLGIHDPYYFSRIFSKIMGSPPSIYRTKK
jgi:AraC-like DNA-binding protein